MEKKSLFSQAKEMMAHLSSQGGNANDTEKHATQRAINAAYENATAEEKAQLGELEQQLKNEDLLH